MNPPHEFMQIIFFNYKLSKDIDWSVAAIARLLKISGNATMEIKRTGSQPSNKTTVEYFAESVRIDTPFNGKDPSSFEGMIVVFESGARTLWHTHPLGQTLIVTSGCGRAQREGGLIVEIRPGDVVWFEPNEKHWHGASPTTAMTHIAIAEVEDGKTVEWLESVSDEQYLAGEDGGAAPMKTNRKKHSS